jgi:hypothetical protein
VIHVVTAKITPLEEKSMTTLIPEENAALAATASSKKPKANKNARLAPRRANVAPVKSKSARKRTPATKASKALTKPEVAKSPVTRDSSKTAKILDLLKRPGGATSKELMKATGWLPHSVRGFLSGTVGKTMGLTVTSIKSEDGQRTYSIES